MDGKLALLLILVVFAFIAFVGFVFFNDQIVGVTQASNQEVSPQQTLLFAWPLEASSDGATASKITIFVRDENGIPVEGKAVVVETTHGTIEQPQTVSGPDGDAIFAITATSPGLAEIRAIVDNIPITKSVTVQFRE